MGAAVRFIKVAIEGLGAYKGVVQWLPVLAVVALFVACFIVK